MLNANSGELHFINEFVLFCDIGSDRSAYTDDFFSKKNHDESLKQLRRLSASLMKGKKYVNWIFRYLHCLGFNEMENIAFQILIIYIYRYFWALESLL